MLKQMGRAVGGILASEDGVQKKAILPVAWVAAVMMAGAFVLSMPAKAHAYCWVDVDCYNVSPSPCPYVCGEDCYTYSSGCVQYGSSGTYRCRCGW